MVKYTVSSLERSAEEMGSISKMLEKLQEDSKKRYADVNAKLAELGVKPKDSKTPTAPHANGVKVPAKPDDKAPAKPDDKAEEYLINLNKYANDYSGSDYNPYADDPYAEDPYADDEETTDTETETETPDDAPAEKERTHEVYDADSNLPKPFKQ